MTEASKHISDNEKLAELAVLEILNEMNSGFIETIGDKVTITAAKWERIRNKAKGASLSLSGNYSDAKATLDLARWP